MNQGTELSGVSVRREFVRELFGEARVLDEGAFQRVFGLEMPEQDPRHVSFPAKLLERAAGLGAFLMFVPPEFSLKFIMEKTGNKTVDGLPIFHGYDWITGRWSTGPKEELIPEKFYVEPMKPGWRLVTTDVIGDELMRNYAGETQVLRTYIRGKMFECCRMPERLQSALEQFDSAEMTVVRALESAFQNRNKSRLTEITKDLVNFDINQMCRETPAEVVLSHVLWNDPATRPLAGRFVHTNCLSQKSSIVRVGFFNSIPKGGGTINETDAHYRDKTTGVRFIIHEDLFKTKNKK